MSDPKSALAGVLVAARLATDAVASTLIPELVRTAANEALEAAAKTANDLCHTDVADAIRALKQ